MAAVRGAMKDIGLEWNERKCSVAHVKRGTLEPEESESAGDSEREVKGLAEGFHYKFLGVRETLNRMTTLVSRSQARLIYVYL